MNNKIITISIIFILISFCFINTCFAYTVDTDYELPETNLFTEYITGKDDNGYYIINGSSTVCDRYFVITDGKELVYIFVSDGYFSDDAKTYYMNNRETYNYIYFEYYLDGSFKRQNSLRNDTSMGVMFNQDYVYTSFDCKFADGTVFFQAPPVMEQETTLAMVLEQNNPMEIFKILMKNVVVSLVVFLVGLVAFLKAWAWLKTQLHKA